MECTTCSNRNPEFAFFCFKCGKPLRGDTPRGTYAASAGEGVHQFALISTVMPHSSRQTADGYRWAMLISAVLILGLTALGLLPIAIASAAFLVPMTYLVYIYDANLWEDTPARVVLTLFMFTGVLAALVTLAFFEWIFPGQFAELLTAGRTGIEGVPIGSLLIFAVLLPLVAEIAKNAPAVLLARRPEFDDMIDALTFGVAAGAAYAAFETIILFWPVITSGDFRTTGGLGSWLLIVANLMVVKSLIYGTATGIAVAAFSGKGAGYDGFTRFYAGNFAMAAGANVLYWVGVRLMASAPFGSALGLLWGVLVLAVLIIRVRVMLHAALLDAALEDATTNMTSSREVVRQSFCPECENILLVGAHFCVVCGASVRSTSTLARKHMTSASRNGGTA